MNEVRLIDNSLEPENLYSDPVYQYKFDLPGSLQYSVKRFAKPADWMIEEGGAVVYNFNASKHGGTTLELRFCITGNVYCNKYGVECNNCKKSAAINCDAKLETVDYFSFTFTASLVNSFQGNVPVAQNLSSSLLAFKHPTSFKQTISVCNRIRNILEDLLKNNTDEVFSNIYVNAQSQLLLLQSVQYLEEKPADVLTCRFLNIDSEREKIFRAKEILLQHIGDPITIKQLSRKVAINECYLKKGFKEVFGSTIFEFYQTQRMEHAKYLLYDKGLSVTEVSSLLGYSSISHFSTAFKKHTGLKPCELLLR